MRRPPEVFAGGRARRNGVSLGGISVTRPRGISRWSPTATPSSPRSVRRNSAGNRWARRSRPPSHAARPLRPGQGMLRTHGRLFATSLTTGIHSPPSSSRRCRRGRRRGPRHTHLSRQGAPVFGMPAPSPRWPTTRDDARQQGEVLRRVARRMKSVAGDLLAVGHARRAGCQPPGRRAPRGGGNAVSVQPGSGSAPAARSLSPQGASPMTGRHVGEYRPATGWSGLVR